ncbi:DNA repair protein RAD5 [Apiospora sp. TS-2023a]
MWRERVEPGGGARYYYNVLTNQTQDQRPNATRGGILNYDMGLGKTLMVLVSIASDKHNHGHHPMEPTLVVMRPTLLSQWQEQIRQHVAPDPATNKPVLKNTIFSILWNVALYLVTGSVRTYVHNGKTNGGDSVFFLILHRLPVEGDISCVEGARQVEVLRLVRIATQESQDQIGSPLE